MDLSSAKKQFAETWHGCVLKFIGMHMLVHGSLASATLSAISLQLFVPAIVIGIVIPVAAVVTKREYARLLHLRALYEKLLNEAADGNTLTEERVHECCGWMRNAV